MIIDCISDLHGYYPELEGGDLLIVAGDLTARDTEAQYREFTHWLAEQKYKKKIFIGGNHDNCLVEKPPIVFGDCEYLCDSDTEFEYGEVEPCLYPNGFFPNFTTVTKKLKIWGSPWTNTFDGINPLCTAFTGTEELLATKFALIPDDIDILVTHGPPYCILDQVKKRHNDKMQNVGSFALLDRLSRIKPKLMVFGHIHEGYGQIQGADTLFINCSHVNEDYEPINEPIRIIL
jgi:Icc-related predicted phosphoesterase